MSENSKWYNFQEEICLHFNSIGARAETNVTKQGIRTKHDIDVLVQAEYLGQSLLWVIEAKKWKTNINKLHVLALRTILDDIGADKGFIISEKGFQSGAVEAAKNTNIKLITFQGLIYETKALIQAEVLKSYRKRIKLIENRYWSHSKAVRLKYGLRDHIWDYPVVFSLAQLLLVVHTIINLAEKNEYPINLETHMIEKRGELVARNFQELINWLNLNLNFCDQKLLFAEIEMIKNKDFNPNLILREGIDLPLNMLMNSKEKLNPDNLLRNYPKD